MRMKPHTTRVLGAALALGALGELLAGCSSLPLPWTNAGLPKLYISDSTVRVRGDSYIEDQTAMAAAMDLLRTRGDLGVFMTPSYIITVDPVVLVQTTSNTVIPSSELVSQPAFGGDGTGTADQQVTRNPLFYLDKAVIRYQIPGYTVPDVEMTLNYAMKGTNTIVDKLPLSYAEPVVRAIYDNPSTTPSARGQVEVIIEGRDMDPLLADGARRVTASRSFPVLYAYNRIILGEVAGNSSPLGAPNPTFSVAP